jgi:hypothetical protein
MGLATLICGIMVAFPIISVEIFTALKESQRALQDFNIFFTGQNLLFDRFNKYFCGIKPIFLLLKGHGKFQRKYHLPLCIGSQAKLLSELVSV